jgi:hypothetical protein
MDETIIFVLMYHRYKLLDLTYPIGSCIWAEILSGFLERLQITVTCATVTVYTS